MLFLLLPLTQKGIAPQSSYQKRAFANYHLLYNCDVRVHHQSWVRLCNRFFGPQLGLILDKAIAGHLLHGLGPADRASTAFDALF